jgi:biopolymer transport protein ExbB
MSTLSFDTWWRLWVDGGWTMIPLFAVALLIYVAGIRLLIHLFNLDYNKLQDSEWGSWVQSPSEGSGEVGEMIRYTQDQVASVGDIQSRFSEVLAAEVPGVDRRLAFINVLVAAAPLLGLLGTVLGMLSTFEAIATGGGKMVDMIARGISEALITTEMGLLIAIPGMVLSFLIKRKRNEFVGFLARLESATVRKFKDGKDGGSTGLKAPARETSEPGGSSALTPAYS